MQTEKIEAIVLKSQDYQERHRLLTLFSPEGLLSMIVSNISRKNGRLLALSTVFSQGEYLYTKKNSELLRFVDGTLLCDHLGLRSSLSHIQTAAALAQALLSTQMHAKPAPELYFLFRAYLSQVPTFQTPTSLLASFYLKLLKHEGLLSFESLLEETENLYFCQEHSPLSLFTEGESPLVHSLLTARNFAHLRALAIPPALFSKITSLLQSHDAFQKSL